MAAASLAAVAGLTQDCEHHQHSDDENPNTDRDKKQLQNHPHGSTTSSANQESSNHTASSSEDLPNNAVPFSPKDTKSMRSIQYESSQSTPISSVFRTSSSIHSLIDNEQSFHHHHVLPTSRVTLPTNEDYDDKSNNNNNNNNINNNRYNARKNVFVCDAYLDASFHSGLVASLPVDEGCFAVAASCALCGLLAVGTRGAIQLYSSGRSSHVWVATIDLPTTRMASHNKPGMVSALAWLDEKTGGRYTLMATTLQGHVSVYTIDPELLEVEGGGIQHLPGGSWKLDSEVRSVAMTNNTRQGMVTAAVGDASGRLHMLYWPVGGANPSAGTASSVTHEMLSLTSSAILNLTWNEDGTHLAVSTQSGDVDVYRIVVPHGGIATRRTISNWDMTTTSTKLVWSTQRAGSVRALSWHGPNLVLGGYDKSCVLVDTHIWGIAREILLDGTINSLSFDSLGRYLAVGCRDKSLTLLDTSTWRAIKSWGTAGWVTSITWLTGDRLVMRSARTRLSVLDLMPIQYSQADRRLYATPTAVSTSSVAAEWLDARRVVRSVGKSLIVADASLPEMATLASWSTASPVQHIRCHGELVDVANGARYGNSIRVV
eukprot:scaffold2102_cov161-Amphora_coffeaeformis.AAC.8